MRIVYETHPYWVLWHTERGGDDYDIYEYRWYFFPHGETEAFFTAIEYKSQRKAKKEYSFYVDLYENILINDTDRISSGEIYYMTICEQETLVFDRIQKRGSLGDIYNEGHAFDIFFIIDRTVYSFWFFADLEEDDNPDKHIGQFWELIDSIECPTLDER
ncbi:MAG: hypothetical protein K8R40_03345 [Anaerolineaceae bacterium]|nr:hypothetical protein [Anaerolineaceae bacterium]